MEICQCLSVVKTQACVVGNLINLLIGQGQANENICLLTRLKIEFRIILHDPAVALEYVLFISLRDVNDHSLEEPSGFFSLHVPGNKDLV